MRRTTFDHTRDQRIADDAQAGQAIMCSAAGCPNRWSVDSGNGQSCSAHAWAPRHLWPEITQQELDFQADRARVQEEKPMPRLTAEEKKSILRKIAGLGEAMRMRRDESPRAWAYALREREQRGEPLNDAQRVAWRNAMAGHQVLDRVAAGIPVAVQAITGALQMTGDIPSWADIDVPTFDEEAP